MLLILATAAVIQLPYWQPSYWSARSELDADRASIRQRKEPLAFADLRPETDEEFALGDEVLAILNRIAKPNAEFRKLIYADPAIPPGDYAILRETLEVNREPSDALAAINGSVRCRFRYDFDAASPMNTILHGVDGLSNVAYLRQADVLQSLGTGDSERAVRAAQELCDTAAFLQQEPFLVSQLVRARIGETALDTLELIFGTVELTRDQFRMIDDRLSEMESTFRLSKTIHAERASLYTTMENIGHPDVRESLGMMAGLGSGGGILSFAPEKSLIDDWASLSYRPKLMHQQAWMLKRMSTLAQWIDVPGTEGQRVWDKNDQEISDVFDSSEDSPLYSLFPAVIYVRNKALAHRQRILAARLALRAAQYHAKEEKLPASLDVVLDGDLPDIPLGLWASKRPHYDVRAGGFLIKYAVPTTSEELDTSVDISFVDEKNATSRR